MKIKSFEFLFEEGVKVGGFFVNFPLLFLKRGVWEGKWKEDAKMGGCGVPRAGNHWRVVAICCEEGRLFYFILFLFQFFFLILFSNFFFFCAEMYASSLFFRGRNLMRLSVMSQEGLLDGSFRWCVMLLGSCFGQVLSVFLQRG